ncbi:MAG: hypothetical protein IPP59_09350 [Betaproteobacteria bacterium]|nr:hypothetical protein [Candidatus Dechloromonas phosphorivorans]
MTASEVSADADHRVAAPPASRKGQPTLAASSMPADVTVELPLQAIGDIDPQASSPMFAWVRMGAGFECAFAGRFATSPRPQCLSFRASGFQPDDSVAILSQAWYRGGDSAMPFGGSNPTRETLELTFGEDGHLRLLRSEHGGRR